MTPDDWTYVETRLRSLYSSVDLMCDGYRVTLTLRQVTPFKNAITVWVNGWLRGSWMSLESEEGRRFYPTHYRHYYRKAARDSLKKMSKRSRELLAPDYDKKYTYKQPMWGSFKLMKKHIIENNEKIELVRGDDTP